MSTIFIVVLGLGAIGWCLHELAESQRKSTEAKMTGFKLVIGSRDARNTGTEEVIWGATLEECQSVLNNRLFHSIVYARVYKNGKKTHVMGTDGVLVRWP